MLRVLTYHRVAEPQSTPWLNPGMVSALPSAFEQQMAHLSRRYAALSLDEVADAAARRKPLPKRAALITFDDGYRDFGEIAWPILRRYRLPATLFVPTGYPGNPERSFWWDRLFRKITECPADSISLAGCAAIPLGTPPLRSQAVRHLQNLVKSMPHAQAMRLIDNLCPDDLGKAPAAVHSWDELRALALDGVNLASHSRSHALLTRLPYEDVCAEVRGAAHDLRREIGRALPVFCYPAGAHDETVLRALKQEGVLVAFTTLDGQNDLKHADPLLLRRTNITPRTTLPIFRLRLQRWASYLDAVRHGHSRASRSSYWSGEAR